MPFRTLKVRTDSEKLGTDRVHFGIVLMFVSKAALLFPFLAVSRPSAVSLSSALVLLPFVL